MEEYIVKYGQTFIDVVLSCYGNLNGLYDFMSSNPNVCYDTEFKEGDVVYYNPGSVYNQVILDFYKRYSITPTNGSKDIYPKYASYDPLFAFYVPNSVVDFQIVLGGSGTVQIDWGDNSDLQEIVLTETGKVIQHSINSYITELRKIVIYGDASFTIIDINGLDVQKFFTFKNFSVLTFRLRNVSTRLLNIGFVNILQDVNEISFQNTKLRDAMALISLMRLRTISLKNSRLTSDAVDNYLLGLVRNYQSRLIATVDLTGNGKPNGIYQQPTDLQYPLSGMEAKWVLENDQDRGWTILIDE